MGKETEEREKKKGEGEEVVKPQDGALRKASDVLRPEEQGPPSRTHTAHPYTLRRFRYVTSRSTTVQPQIKPTQLEEAWDEIVHEHDNKKEHHSRNERSRGGP